MQQFIMWYRIKRFCKIYISYGNTRSSFWFSVIIWPRYLNSLTNWTVALPSLKTRKITDTILLLHFGATTIDTDFFALHIDRGDVRCKDIQWHLHSQYIWFAFDNVAGVRYCVFWTPNVFHSCGCDVLCMLSFIRQMAPVFGNFTWSTFRLNEVFSPFM